MENQYGPGDDAPPVAILGRLKRGIKKDNPTKILTVYLGLSLVVVFLVAASLAPQLSQKWSTLQVKKQSQLSQAATSQIIITADQKQVYINHRIGIAWRSPYTTCNLTQYPAESSSPWKGKVIGSGYLNIYPTQAGYYYFSAQCGNTTIVDKTSIKVNVTNPPQAPPQSKISPCYPLGDVNNDYYITSKDADLVLAIVAKTALPTGLPTDYLVRADVDAKSSVNSADALLIKKLLTSQDPNFTFPACASLQFPF